MTSVINCNCNHEYQDRKYGTGKRVHNHTPTGYGNKQNGWRCTVCKSVKPESAGQEAK